MRLPTQMFLYLLAASSILCFGIYANYGKLSNPKIGTFDDEWKCPYCHRWSATGSSCQNPKCSSKY